MPDDLSISREVCKYLESPNANPSHLHPELRNPILPLVNSPQASPDSVISLAQLRQGDAAVVSGLAEATGIDDKAGAAALLSRLRDLGFIAGARCEVMARMWLGGDPMVVRVGGSTFALRRAEAAAVRVSRAA